MFYPTKYSNSQLAICFSIILRTVLTIATLFLITTAQSQTSARLLDSAYSTNSTKLLKQFFHNWQKEIKPIGKTELKGSSDTQKRTYSLFKKFYNPHRIGRLGGSEWGNHIYRGVDFLIVQNYIPIYFTNKLYYSEQDIDEYVVDYINKHVKKDSTKQKMLERKNGKLSKDIIEIYQPKNNYFRNRSDTLTDSIINFRPKIHCKGQPLYLTPGYSKLLDSFLGNKFIPLGEEGIMNPAHSAGESERRKLFLEKYIKIWYGHWGGYWQLHTYPTADYIVFDKDMKYAKINFTIVYEGGEALYKNKHGRWKLIRATRTWIE